ncbi:unnamed protein product [Menidia menidia]|uniref:Galactose mutarotase n=1 Tax=Menidia menidia TaxID=238744 RepID=A0A8S4BRQ8_9TELE|nr:unnamed protein product [Menidia menidia]
MVPVLDSGGSRPLSTAGLRSFTSSRPTSYMSHGAAFTVTRKADLRSPAGKLRDPGLTPGGLDFVMTRVSVEPWGGVPGLGNVDLWRLETPQVQVQVLTLGATIRAVHCRGAHGRVHDVVLGYDDLEGYVADRRYFGAVVGRVANRIAGGRFTVEGKEYQLDINSGPNSIHGGLRGFNKAIWEASEVEGGVKLSLTSPDGDQGYPGAVDVSVTYTLQEETLTAEYRARSTKTTPINLTNHSYFNLAGQEEEDIYGHQVSIRANSFLPVDDRSIPTGF